MDKLRIGIPRGLCYEEENIKWRYFLERLGCEIVESVPTNRKILELGKEKAVDEMCLSFQIYLGHIAYLQNKVDYVLVPRIDNYGRQKQTCTNFQAMYDIVSNLFDIKLLHYNIDLEHHETEKMGFYQMGKVLGKSRREIKKAYQLSVKMSRLVKDKKISKNYNRMSRSGKKILLVGHSYILHDDYLMEVIKRVLKESDVTYLYSDYFDSDVSEKASKKWSSDLYWKMNKENIGAIALLEKQLSGVIFVSTFPCGCDLFVNELVIRKLKLPYIELVLDDLKGSVFTENRIESFVDML